jgi:hypothetical protein
MVLLYDSGLCRFVSLDGSSLSGSGYSAGPLINIDRTGSLSHQTIGEFTQESSGHSLYHCRETSF